jgi:hydrogenase maturation factor
MPPEKRAVMMPASQESTREVKTVAEVVVEEEEAVADEVATAALVLAKRFAAGATLWCVAPQWPSHARHVAVEFVHPVIVGKRALPAAVIEADDPAAALRLLGRPGDVVLVVSSAVDRRGSDLMRRAPAWGLTRLWVGAGPRPAAGHAEQVVWLDDVSAPVAARSGQMVLLYHLLWELTHVVFEHPGLVLDEPAGNEEVCITCSDRAQVAEVQALGGENLLEVIVDGRTATVDGTLVAPAAIGDLVLVHAGIALSPLPSEGEPG